MFRLPPFGSTHRIPVQGFILLSGLALFHGQAFSATFTVTNINDSGAGSFRQAIFDANANSGADIIEFQIPGGGPHTISPASALPALIETVTVNATTQAGYSNRPVIELNGASAGGGVVGLRVVGTGSTVRGLAINRFGADGIRLDGSGNVIRGNYIGTDVTGTIARGNNQHGIWTFNTSSNLIGGTTVADRNVISGANDTGIYILTGSGNVVQGNYIGVTAAGTNDLGNRNNGVVIYNGSANTIGGSAAGTGNVIAGNDASGINLQLGGATGNVIQGNYIGLNAAGAAAISNTADGITLNEAPANLIGGTNSGERNLISGNGQAGIFLNGANARQNSVLGNYIGTDAAGATAVGNKLAGITLSGASSNVIGGMVGAARNVISGNKQDGVFATNSIGNCIQGNYIGLNVSGSAALANAGNGITLDNSPANLVGGSTTGEGNVISGNGSFGIWLHNLFASGNAIKGNLIGTTPAGTSAIGNTTVGIGITDAPGNVVGGTSAGERNVISGNGFPANQGGVFLLGSGASGNKFFGNHIGTDSTGLNALPNRYEGILISGSGSNIIGSELPGGGNLISGNTTRGLYFVNSSSYNVIRGNFIGVKSDGVSDLGNGQHSVEFEAGCNSNSVGGLLTGAGNRIAYAKNYSGNGPYAGVRVRSTAAYNSILGNNIFNNGALGISFSGLTPTANDACDGDSGGNTLQNFPMLTQAFSGATSGVRGFLNSASNTTFRLQFFASPACDPSGSGEGQIYLGDKLVTIGAGCSNGFVASLPVSVPPGYTITATAMDPANNTSEFSACQPVSIAPRLSIVTVGASQISLAWTNLATGFVLKAATNLSPPIVWTTVTNVPVNGSGQFQVTLTRQPGNRFYLLNFE